MALSRTNLTSPEAPLRRNLFSKPVPGLVRAGHGDTQHNIYIAIHQPRMLSLRVSPSHGTSRTRTDVRTCLSAKR
jgi:hypothetical protein